MNPCGIHITDHKDTTDYQEHVYENDLAYFISHVIFTLASSNQPSFLALFLQNTMFTGHVGPVGVCFYWSEAVLKDFYWPLASGLPLVSSPVKHSAQKEPLCAASRLKEPN